MQHLPTPSAELDCLFWTLWAKYKAQKAQLEYDADRRLENKLQYEKAKQEKKDRFDKDRRLANKLRYEAAQKEKMSNINPNKDVQCQPPSEKKQKVRTKSSFDTVL